MEQQEEEICGEIKRASAEPRAAYDDHKKLTEQPRNRRMDKDQQEAYKGSHGGHGGSAQGSVGSTGRRRRIIMEL